MRTFLICEEKLNWRTCKPEKFIIKGVYSGELFPAHIQNDPEYSYKKYGVRHPRIIEVRNYCNIEII